MLKNYIKIAWRNLLRHKGYTYINLTGLAVGMACCLLIAMYVQDELSYDKYHTKGDQIYRVVHAYRNSDTPEQLPPPAAEEFQVWGNAPVGPALAADFPEILSRELSGMGTGPLRPVLVLKGAFKSSASGIALRKGLVVFQFSLSMALIAGTVIVFSQLNHLRNKNLGFRQEQMVVVDFGFDDAFRQKIETIKTVFEEHPAVLSAAASRSVPGDFIPNASTEIQTSEGVMKTEDSLLYEVDFDFVPHFEIEMAAGRAYSRDFMADTTQSLLLNETAAKLYGYTNPANAVGKRFSQWGREGTIVGVVKDFNFRSLHNRVEPLALRYAPPGGALTKLSLGIQSENLPATLAELEQLWGNLVPHYPFLYSFLDESFNQQYQADLRFGQVFSVFAGLAIFIACLGLLGLVTYTAQQRTKEIGIRKVLGASVFSIVSLLSRDFLKLVLVAAIIAFPVAWYAMNKWLEDFPYRIDIPLWVFLAAGVVSAMVAFLTISYQAIKAARANPIKNLRTE
ncbi:MAG: hypothetical protein KY428_01555 [Bacteroidetes bacterium]|nr:hypothetical protein [Bacteroidota bacterium]